MDDVEAEIYAIVNCVTNAWKVGLLLIDLDEKMIAKARRRQLEGVTFKVMDASRLEFPDNEFDAVVDFGIIHHISN